MDNLTGDVNWFNQDVVKEVKEDVEVKEYKSTRKPELLLKFKEEVVADYENKPSKKLGDALVYLKLLSNIFKDELK